MQKDFQGEPITFVETIHVKDGVVCEVFSFDENPTKDLGIVSVVKGARTPLQKVLKGEKTIEGYVSGKGKLVVGQENGETVEYMFPGAHKEIEIGVGETMQWHAIDSELTFYEICHPPYEEGRYRNLSD